jgi:hypothetical protein
VDEFGNVQFCSAQRGRLNKPVVEYTEQDIKRQASAYKGCEEGCSLLCAYRASAFDNQPLKVLGAALRLARHAVRRP